MTLPRSDETLKVPRRDFLMAMGAAGAGMAMGSRPLAAAPAEGADHKGKGVATVRGAFLYPSTESLRKAGYYSWPGVGFDAEGRQKKYTAEIDAIARRLGMRILMDAKPLSDAAGVTGFVNEVKQQRPDGLLLIPLKKGDWGSVLRIVEEAGLPAVVLATLGILLTPHINQLHRRPGVYLICSLDNLEAVEYGMNMIRTARWMKESRLLSIAGTGAGETAVKGLGVGIRSLPRARFTEEYRRTETSARVRELARKLSTGARRIVEPSEAEIVEAAKTYIVLRRLLADEEGDAVMMDCLGGIRDREFPPPCIGFMWLRDEGIAAGCQNDLDAALTLMIVEELFGRPGFQQNASCETEKNHYFGAHCTCPTRLSGKDQPPEPYLLRNHAESGVGVVPQVLWRTGQAVTMAHYLSGEKPEMIVYSGKVVRCYDTPPAGGCRTNVELAIDGIEDACDVKGMHQTIFYGDYARQLRAFCQLHGIDVVT